jgi:hypothetical protein
MEFDNAIPFLAEMLRKYGRPKKNVLLLIDHFEAPLEGL